MTLAPRRKHALSKFLCIGVIALIILTAYAPALHGQFLWDDPLLIRDNPLLRNVRGLWAIWFTTKPVDYFPLTYSCLWLQWHLWGDSTIEYHLVNLLLHFASCLLLWGILIRLKLPRIAVFLATLLFAIHPVNAMSVAWMSELKNTLSLPLYLLACWFWIANFVEPDPNLSRQKTGWFYFLSLCFFIFALLAKSSLVLLPVVFLILIWWRRGRITMRDVLRTIPFFLLAIGAGVITLSFQNHGSLIESRLAPVSWSFRIARAAWAFWFYIFKAIWPAHLTVIYPSWQPRNILLEYFPAIALIALAIALWLLRNFLGRGPLAAMAYILACLLPVLGLIDTAFLWYSPVSDHLQYAAIIGVIVLVAWGLAWIIQRNRPAGIILVSAIVLLFWFQTRSRAAVYQTEQGFWQSAVAGNPESAQAHYNLGTVFQRKGELPAAMASYRRAIDLQPRFADAHNNLGLLLMKQRNYDDAVMELELARTYRPDAISYRNLGLALLADKRRDDGINALYASVHLDSSDLNTRLELAAALSERNEYDRAIIQARQAVQIDPNSVNALNDLSWYLANYSQSNQSARDEAVVYAKKACELTQNKDPAILDTLAYAYFADGQHNAAINVENNAIALAKSRPGSKPLLPQLIDHRHSFGQ